MTQDLSPPATGFVARLNAALAALPPAARADVVREIEGHLIERQAAGQLEASLAAMGSPEAFAQTYLEDRVLSQALSRPNPLILLFAVLNRAGRSTLAFLFGSVAALLYLLSFAFAVLIALKAITPANVGWWASPGHLVFGAIYGTHPAGPERLGFWFLPIALGAAVACYTLARMLLRLVSQVLLRRSATVGAAMI